MSESFGYITEMPVSWGAGDAPPLEEHNYIGPLGAFLLFTRHMEVAFKILCQRFHLLDLGYRKPG